MTAHPDTASTPSASVVEPVSARIRRRLQEAGRRVHANDNIAEFIADEAELEALEEEVARRCRDCSNRSSSIPISDHNTHGTARRVARMFVHEVFKGRYRRFPGSPNSRTSSG